MKAYFIDKFGIENIEMRDVKEPSTAKGFVKVNPVMAGINPLDYNVIAGKVLYGINPMPHIPGSEILAIVSEDSGKFRKGDRVVVYNRIYDGTCEYCISGREYLCSNGGIYGVVSNGGFAETLLIKEENLYRVPDTISDEVAVSFPIAAMTPYHALKEAGARAGQTLMVYGASGNTGIFAIQMANMMGLNVFAVSSKAYLDEYGARETFPAEKIPDDFKADIVINPLGGEFFSKSLTHVQRRGKLITFGVMNGRDTTIDIGRIYTNEISIIGSTGGSRQDMRELIDLASGRKLKVKTDKIFQFDQLKDALVYFGKPRDGRVLIRF